MEGYFSGAVIVLYMLARYAAEPIFVAACFFGSLYSFLTYCFLRFGACGRMIRAARRAGRFVRKGVISGESRLLFSDRCLKGTPLPFRTAYAAFTEGRVSRDALASVGVSAVKVRGRLLRGGMIGGSVLSAILVFLTFYPVVAFSETLLRTAIVAFHGAANCLALAFFLFGYERAGERAAVRFSEIVDRSLLRKREPEPLPELRMRRERTIPSHEEPPIAEREEIRTLRALLREIEQDARAEEHAPFAGEEGGLYTPVVK